MATRPEPAAGVIAAPRRLRKADDAGRHPAAPPPTAETPAGPAGDAPRPRSRAVAEVPKEPLSTRVPRGYGKALKAAALELDIPRPAIETIVREGLRLWFEKEDLAHLLPPE